jgi:hypothetical protein
VAYGSLVRTFLISIVVAGCGGAAPAGTHLAGERVEPQCVLPADPEVVKQDGNAVLLRWEMPADDFWFARGVPDDAKYLAYRRTIREAGADLERPIADDPVAKTDEEREMWKRERENAELTFASGRVRRINCLDAALFAYQHARYDQLAQPTEFVATVLRRQAMIRVYFGAGDMMFPPKTVYGLDESRADVAKGWQLAVHLHNHTIQKRAGKHALGTPSPSTADVGLLRGVAEDPGLETVWVTNGMFTGEVPAGELARYRTRD